MLTKTLSDAKKKQRNILIKAMNNDIGSIDSAKDSWNPAQISERAKDISYIRSLVDSWNPAQLNEALKMLDFPVIDTWNPAQIEEQRRNLVFYLAERTLTGNPITLKILGNSTPKVTGLKITMNPIQDLHGYSNPWAGGAGKNKVDEATVWSASYSDGLITNPSSNDKFYIPSALVGVQLTFSAYVKANTSSASCRVRAIENGTAKDGNLVQTTDTYSLTKVTFTPASTSDYVVLVSGGANGTYKEVQLEIGATNTSYAPYSNICPISGRTEASVTRTAGEDVETKTHQYSDTIYGGVDDFVNGELTNNRGYIKLSNMPSNRWNKLSASNTYYMSKSYSLPLAKAVVVGGIYPISDRYIYQMSGKMENNSMRLSDALYIRDDRFTTLADWLSYVSNTDAEICYDLATPTTISTSAEEITLLKGENVLSTDGDSIELKYKQNF